MIAAMKRILVSAATLGLVLTGCSHGSKADSAECKQIKAGYYAALESPLNSGDLGTGAVDTAFTQAGTWQDKARAAGCPVPDVARDLGVTPSPSNS